MYEWMYEWMLRIPVQSLPTVTLNTKAVADTVTFVFWYKANILKELPNWSSKKPLSHSKSRFYKYRNIEDLIQRGSLAVVP
jgi:hypothetical protein